MRQHLHRLLGHGPHTCPWWLGYSFDNPVRRVVHDADRMLGRFVAPGDTVADIGCGLGYFSLALARLVGDNGRVIALDVQAEMIKRAERRARRVQLHDRIDFRVCAEDRLDLPGPLDFALAFWMIHEAKDSEGLIREVFAALKPSKCLLIAEPKVHVPGARFAESVEQARAAGFEILAAPTVRLSRAVLCRRQR